MKTILLSTLTSSAFATVRRLALVVSLVFLPTGCSELLYRDDYTHYRAPVADLHRIETITLEDMSATQPVSVEDAAAGLLNRGASVARPAESMRLTLAQVRASALANNLDLKIEWVNPPIDSETILEV